MRGSSASPRGMAQPPSEQWKKGKAAQFYKIVYLLCRYSQRLFLWDFYLLQPSQFDWSLSAWDAGHRPCFAGAVLVLGELNVSSQLAGHTPACSQKVRSLCCTILLIRVHLAGSVPCWHSHIVLGPKLAYICLDWEGGVQLLGRPILRDVKLHRRTQQSRAKTPGL